MFDNTLALIVSGVLMLFNLYMNVLCSAFIDAER